MAMSQKERLGQLERAYERNFRCRAPNMPGQSAQHRISMLIRAICTGIAMRNCAPEEPQRRHLSHR